MQGAHKNIIYCSFIDIVTGISGVPQKSIVLM